MVAIMVEDCELSSVVLLDSQALFGVLWGSR